MTNDTIAGLATPEGEGGIAIVRISGADAIAIFEKAFKPRGNFQPPYESHRLMVGHVVDGEEIVDEAMGVVMRAPRSYTREDVCELHTHGGSAAATLTMRLLFRLGARPAEAGEFTRRAFLNGRIDLAQAEAVMGVISARSAAALRAEERQLSGASHPVRKAQERLITLLSGLEAHIDYPDEIDEAEATQGLLSGLDALINDLTAAADERGARILREGLRVTLCGRPNAGKSTLFNALLGEERAIVTAVPGTTRDVLEGAFSLDGHRVILTDTAGLRESADEVERIGVSRARDTLSRADVALLMVDASAEPSAEERELLTSQMPCPCAVLLNKEDAGEKLTLAQAEALTPHRPILRLSAKAGEGIGDVLAYLRGFLKAPREDMLTNERHMAVARQALESLGRAREGLRSDQPLDLAAVDMHEALYLLGRITGDSVDEGLLDEIFSHFCVGK